MTLRLNGSTSGYVEIDAPATAGSNNITLPSGNGSANQFLKNGSTAGTLGWSSMVEDSSGRLLVGTSTATSSFKFGGSGDTATLTQFDGESSSRDVGLALVNHHTSDTQPVLRLAKSRGTAASPTVVNNGDYTGSIQFMGYDGTRYIDTARIDSVVDTTPGSNDMPGSLRFLTTADGASVTTERMRLTSDGSLYLYTLSGSPSAMANIKYDTSTKEVYYDTSSRLVKENITDLQHGLEAVKAIQPRTYTAIGGNPDQEIIGFIADELVSVVPEAVFSGPKAAITGNNEDTETIPLGISYDSLIPVLVKALQEAVAKIETQDAAIAALETRLAALEATP